ncbi:MAG: carbohydrate kinase [Rubrobacter sp.]|nr:carbohydrate kinase [Rubrobacter sp.]
MTTEPLLIGADIGTTNIKVVAFGPDGRIVARASTPTPTHYPKPGCAYHDPEELWRSFVTALRKVTQQLYDTNRVASIAIASFAEAAVPLDAHGRPTNDVIAWFDNRTQPQAEWLDRLVGKDRLFGLTGLSLQPIFGLCKLLWLRENEPEAFSRTSTWLNVADYIAFRLSGVCATDYSLASRTLALDLSRLRWADELLQEVDVPSGLFAPLRPSGSPLGPVKPEVAAETGLPKSTRVAVGGHDHVCGALAVGVIEPGMMLDSLGTTEALFLPLERPLTDPEVGRQGYTQGAHVAGGYYVLGGQYTFGASIEWFRDALGSESGYETLIAEAEKVPAGSLGVLFLPHLRLSNPPYDDPRSRGAFVGLSTDTKRGTLFRAVLEGLAFESRASLEPLLDHSNVVEPKSIYAIGGVTQNRLLMNIKATVLGQPVTVFDAGEATSLGAAILGGVGAGIYADIPSARKEMHHTTTAVDPVADQVALYEALFSQVYQQVYPALRTLHQTIHHLQANE